MLEDTPEEREATKRRISKRRTLRVRLRALQYFKLINVITDLTEGQLDEMLALTETALKYSYVTNNTGE